MKSVGGAAAFICVCSIICTVISLLLPDTVMKKPARFALTLFFLCSLIAPIKSFCEGISQSAAEIQSIPSTTAQESDFDFEQEVFKETLQDLTNTAGELLREEGIEANNIIITAHIDSNSRIKLDKISIYISEADTLQVLKINSIITEKFEKAPEIITERDYEQ